MSFFRELRRRNVFRVAVAYVVTGWLLLQVADLVLDNTSAPPWVMQVFMLAVVLGFVAAVVVAWAYELTPEGLKPQHEVDHNQSITRLTGRKLDFVIIAVLVLALGYFVWERQWGPRSAPGETDTVATSAQPAGTPGPSADKSIAVLPFVNLSSDPEQDYFSDGISEELLNVLAQVPELRVAARTSSFSFKGQNLPIGDIADALNVAHVLEGSVRKAGERLRITAQLIKAEDGFHLWSDTWDRDLDDIFAIQDEIAHHIGEALRVELELEPAQPGGSGPIIESANTEAYDAYLKGRQLVNRRGRSSLEEAERELERAVRLDNDFAPAHAQLAIAISLLLNSPSSYGSYTLEQVRERAEPHIQRAFELAPRLAEAHGARALLALGVGDGETCIPHARTALEINPSYTDAINWKYLCEGQLGLHREAIGTLEHLLRVDPLSFAGRFNYVSVLAARLEFERAAEVADSLSEHSTWASSLANVSVWLNQRGGLAKAVNYELLAFADEPTDAQTNGLLIDTLGEIGLYDEARRISDDLRYRAEIKAGDYPAAIELLNRQLQQDARNPVLLLPKADALHASGQVVEAIPVYLSVMEEGQAGRPITDFMTTSLGANARLALGQRAAGDDAAARATAELMRGDLEARWEAGLRDSYDAYSRSLLAAFEGNTERALAQLEEALDHNLRDRTIFNEPLFEPLRDDPRFVSLRAGLDETLARERAQVLQLICHHNPVPHAWRPLPATCEGVATGPSPLAP